MDMNYLVQRKINAQKKYRRKVTLTIALSVILLILIIIGLVKVVKDDKKEESGNNKSENQVSGELTPGIPTNAPVSENNGDTGEKTVDPQAPLGETEITPTAVPTETPASIPVASKKVAIDAGHGGDVDLGSVRQGLFEKNANLAIALYLKAELESRGYEVYMIRETDAAVENKERPGMALESGADIYVSVHLNSLDEDSDATRGAEAWYSDLRNDGSDVLAQCVVDELTKVIDTRNRGIKLSNNLIVLKYNELPACLVECGFISSETERAKLFDPEYQKKIAEGIANGIEKFLPLE